MDGRKFEREGTERNGTVGRDFDLLIRTLLLRVQDAEAGDG